jgi:hypothetical protein
MCLLMLILYSIYVFYVTKSVLESCTSPVRSARPQSPPATPSGMLYIGVVSVYKQYNCVYYCDTCYMHKLQSPPATPSGIIIHTYIHTCIHTYLHIYIHTYIHTIHNNHIITSYTVSFYPRKAFYEQYQSDNPIFFAVGMLYMSFNAILLLYYCLLIIFSYYLTVF